MGIHDSSHPWLTFLTSIICIFWITQKAGLLECYRAKHLANIQLQELITFTALIYTTVKNTTAEYCAEYIIFITFSGMNKTHIEMHLSVLIP